MTNATQIDAMLHAAAFAEIADRAWLRASGPDATRWLNGMVTNNIRDLAPGEGNYNFLLNAQGRIEGDCTVFREPGEPPTFLLETQDSQLETLQKLLDRFIIMDDVELVPVEGRCGVLVAGPQALSIVAALGTGDHAAAPCPAPLPQTVNLKQTAYAGAAVWLIQAHGPLVPRFEIWSDAATVACVLAELDGGSAERASADDLEALRVLEGTPRYGTDIRNTDAAKDLPQETAQAHALSFTKGCYLGQEIVERIHSRGAVHRTFSQFRLAGTLPQLPAPLTANGKPVGELTSAAVVPLPEGDITIALGYARLEALNQPLAYPGGSATTRNPKLATQN